MKLFTKKAVHWKAPCESLGQAGLPWWSVIERYQCVCRANSWSLQKRSARSAAARSFGRPLTPSHVANLSVYLRTCGLQKLHVKHILIENPSHIIGFLLILWISLCSQLLPLRAGASSRGAHFSIFPQRHWIIFGGMISIWALQLTACEDSSNDYRWQNQTGNILHNQLVLLFCGSVIELQQFVLKSTNCSAVIFVCAATDDTSQEI